MTAPSEQTGIRRTPLFWRHADLGAKRAPFAGYDMPVFYRGIYEEAAAVRTRCGMFDVSHMARLGFGAPEEKFLEKLLTCDVSKIRAGGGSYALVLNEDGGILDDVILYRKPAPAGEFLLVVNASNHEKIARWIRDRGGQLTDLTAGTAMIAVQGPKSEEILSKIVRAKTAGTHARAKLGDMPYFSGCDMDWDGVGQIWVSRTGYTGEDGFEIVSAADHAEKIWNWLANVGSVTPCGLGARDVLRIEAGYSLYGSDMDENASPYECGLGFAVAAKKDFIGAEALKRRTAANRLIGIDAGDQPSVVVRHGYPILSGGRRVGNVTSGVFSKTLSRSIGFGSIGMDVPDGAALSIDVRGREVSAKRVSRRFIQGRVKSRNEGDGKHERAG